MKAQTKRVVLALTGVLLLAVGGFAWACTLASSVAVDQNRGPAGVPVNISGATFGPGPVEVRWNSADGPLLATAQGPEFSVAITPPAGTQPDVYYVVAIQKGPEGTFKASETFEVTGSTGQASPTQAVSNNLWSAFSSETSLETNIAQSAPAPGNSSNLMLGISLLGVGLTGLLAAATLPAIKSRRSKAQADKG